MHYKLFMRKFFCIKGFSLVSRFFFMFMKFFFLDFSLFFVQGREYVNNLTARIIAAVYTYAVGNIGLGTMTAVCKQTGLERVMRSGPVSLTLRMSHSDYHVRILTESIMLRKESKNFSSHIIEYEQREEK